MRRIITLYVVLSVVITGCSNQITPTSAPSMSFDSSRTKSFEEGVTAYRSGDYTKAIHKLSNAAEQGHVDAQVLLGAMHYIGGRIPKNYAEAIRWYQMAAEKGHYFAQFQLGCIYSCDLCDPAYHDYTKAIKWYRKAAEQGYHEAQVNLAGMYYNAKGVPQDYRKAIKWYRRASEQGNAQAQATIGYMYEEGKAFPRDYKEAAKWYRKAAEGGNAIAQANLARLYFTARGVPHDYVQAYIWFNIAAIYGDEDSDDFLHIIERFLSEKELEEADAFIQKWLKGHSEQIKRQKEFKSLLDSLTQSP